MENSLENKAKLFAQYWGQAVQRYGNNFYTKVVNSFIDDSLLVGDYLLLKPLSSITNEDAKKLSVIEADFRTDDVWKRGKNIAKWIEDAQYSVGNLNTMMQMIDYLRSKGYALPYMGLSVETMVEYGWIK